MTPGSGDASGTDVHRGRHQSGGRAVARLDRWLGERVDLSALDVLRVLVGPVVLLHLWPFLDDARHGHIYRDAFHEPYLPWLPHLPRAAYVALLCAGALAAVGMTLRIRPRACAAVTFVIVLYNLLLSTTHFHNNRAYLVIVLGAVAAATVGEGPAWPLRLLRIEAATVYGASGFSKLVDADWFGGTVTWGRVVKVEDRLPAWLPDVLLDRGFHTYAAKVIVLTELFIGVGLLWRRTRIAAIGAAIAFHVAIALTANVEVFSILGIAALVIWLEPAQLSRLRPPPRAPADLAAMPRP